MKEELDDIFDNIPPLDKNSTIGDVAIYISFISRDIRRASRLIKELKKDFEDLKKYHVTIEQFNEYKKYGEDRETRLSNVEKKVADYPLIKKLVYGACGFILAGFMYALINGFIPNAHI